MARSRATLITAMLAISAAPASAFIATNTATAAQPSASPQIRICHAAGDKYEELTVDGSSSELQGHLRHAGDIIPAYSHGDESFPGQNMVGNEGLYGNGCNPVPAASPSPTATTTSPSPTAPASPSATASASPTSESSASPTASAGPSQSQTSPPVPEPTPTVTQTVVVSVPGGVQIVEGSVAPSPEVTTQDSIVPPLGATVPEDAFTEMELAEEGVIEPLAATVPEFVNAGGGSAGQSGEGPTGAIGLMVLSAIAGAGAVVRLARQ